MRVAIFSPLPPHRSGIAHYTADLLPLLSGAHEIDLYTDCVQPHSPVVPSVNIFDAHDFVWRRKRTPYERVIYQLGNATCHDYMWPYLAHYPGHIVLHDGHVHHSRARSLLSQKRYDAYRAEFALSHSDCPTDVAELGVQGLLGNLTYFWPMLGVPMTVSHSVSVHNSRLAEELQRHYPNSHITTIRMGVTDPTSALDDSKRNSTRDVLGFSSNHVVFAAYGGLTPEKRIPQILRAVERLKQTTPLVRLLLVGNPVTHYDARADARALGIEHLVTFTDYVADADLPQYLAAADVYLCLRWPSTGETSASMIRCFAMGKPVVTTDLVLNRDIPMLLTPWTWTLSHPWMDTAESKPLGVAIDILDENHSLEIAVRRLSNDASLRNQLGVQARQYWEAHHRLEMMAEDYEKLLNNDAPATTAQHSTMPLADNHNRNYAHDLLSAFGVTPDILKPRTPV